MTDPGRPFDDGGAEMAGARHCTQRYARQVMGAHNSGRPFELWEVDGA